MLLLYIVWLELFIFDRYITHEQFTFTLLWGWAIAAIFFAEGFAHPSWSIVFSLIYAVVYIIVFGIGLIAILNQRV